MAVRSMRVVPRYGMSPGAASRDPYGQGPPDPDPITTMDGQAGGEIRSFRRPDCYLCGSTGLDLYRDLRDRLFGVSGQWNLKRCPNAQCRLVWLDPMPAEEDIGKAYKRYYTHTGVVDTTPAAAPKPLRSLLSEPRPLTTLPSALPRALQWQLYCRYWQMYRHIEQGYLRRTYNYTRGSGARWHHYLAPLAFLFPAGLDGFDYTVSYLPAPAAGARCLEIGCGNGDQLASMQGFGWEVEGVDFDPLAVRACRLRGLSVRTGTLAEQAYPDGYFDAVYMFHVVEHVHDPIGLLRECGRVLRPGGVMVVLTPNTESWGHHRFQSSWLHLDPPRHLMLFSPVSLQAAVERAGFSIETLRTSVRIAAATWDISAEIRQTGMADMSRPAIGSTCAATIFQLLVRARALVHRGAGEEIVLTARNLKRPYGQPIPQSITDK